MVEVTITGDTIRCDVQGWHKLWALRSQLEFPLAHVRSVRHDAEAARGWWHGMKMPGTNIPGILTAGTFYQHEGAVFYDIQDPEHAVVLELDHEHFARLVIEVEDPAATVAMIRDAMARTQAT
ncbi:MAG: hypothetical protein V4558_12510 [Gemmatimonadota bacterium]